MELNSAIEKVYVLTIDRNIDRHDSVSKILSNIPFEYWYGLDLTVLYPSKTLHEIPKDFFSDYHIDREHVLPWTKGQLGAYTSIKEMVTHVAKEQFKATLIFEDDFYPLMTNWREIFHKAYQQLPENWDIVLLGYLYDGRSYKYAYHRKTRFLSYIANAVNKILKRKFIKMLPKKFSKNLDFAGICTGGHAYCISAKGARLLQNYFNPMQKAGDELISKLIAERKINAFTVYPCLFLQDPKFVSKTKIV